MTATTENKNESATLLVLGHAEVHETHEHIIAGWGSCKKCNCGGFVKNDPPNGRCEHCNHSFTAHEGWG